MYQENKKKRSRRNVKKSRKSLALLASFLLMLMVSIGGSIAFLIAKTDTVANTFVSSTVTTAITEKLEGNTKSNVKIQNTGDTDAYIRAAVVVTWQDASGNIYGQKPTACSDSSCNHTTCEHAYIISYDLSNGWEKGSDGFYYWTKPVAGAVVGSDDTLVYSSTGTLISSCTAIGTAPDSNFHLNVEVLGSPQGHSENLQVHL